MPHSIESFSSVSILDKVPATTHHPLRCSCGIVGVLHMTAENVFPGLIAGECASRTDWTNAQGTGNWNRIAIDIVISRFVNQNKGSNPTKTKPEATTRSTTTTTNQCTGPRALLEPNERPSFAHF